MLDTYETIELFGLTETADDLVIPNDDILRDKIVRETFENLFAELKGTGLAREIDGLDAPSTNGIAMCHGGHVATTKRKGSIHE